MRRIAITGLGLHTSLGEGKQKNWERVLLPRAEIAPASSLLQGYARARELSISAIQEALEEAALWLGPEGRLSGADAERVGSTFSASKPLFLNDDAVLSPGLLSQEVHAHFGLAGESRTLVAACATGAYALAMAAGWIEQNLCDVVIAGSVEPRLHPLMAAGFKRMGVVSEEPVMRPFDQARAGFVFGEGAGAVVLEAEDHARARGVHPLAYLSGWASGADGHSPVAFNSGGERIAAVVRKALAKAQLVAADIGHVNAHGTATRLNDALETQALHKAFGGHAGQLKISATKSTTGHLLGAAGSVEFVLTVLALRAQMIPPTAHLTTKDPECDLDYTANAAQSACLRHALSLSFGFGGPIGVLVASRC